MRYEGALCPFCGEIFDKDSDVVVCPDCGTPAHRSCYKEAGSCKNESRHGFFKWENPNKPEEEKKAEEIITPLTKVEVEKSKNGYAGEIQISSDGVKQSVLREIRGDEKIGDYTVDDYGKVIDKNINKFIPRFMMFTKTNRRISWNWAAFFFGPFWLAYRKMNKFAGLAMLLIMLIPLIFFSDVLDYYQTTSEMYSEVMTSTEYATSAELEKALDNLEANMPTQPAAITASTYVEMAVDILCGLYGNYLYFRKCTKILEKASKKETEEAKAKFIKNKGGRSIASVVLFIIEFYIVSIVVGVVLYYIGTDLGTILRRYIN